ncbi:hypothetical protein GE061_004955 [Apolygus lucorum]|uniref:Uncharacterized protein n=1 Tax=Apolygus lucorum TaxID=248454 RepID=A0A8S9WUU8_APOLU|nr:hypothetical protein GE061_004955 [Apolygus lucorum]
MRIERCRSLVTANGNVSVQAFGLEEVGGKRDRGPRGSNRVSEQKSPHLKGTSNNFRMEGGTIQRATPTHVCLASSHFLRSRNASTSTYDITMRYLISPENTSMRRGC